MKKKLLYLLIIICLVISLFFGFFYKKSNYKEFNVVKDEEFNNIYIDDYSIAQFNDLGFDFGDSVNITFDNGISFEDVPYYSGYYVPVGELLLCGYPGYPHVVIARNYGKSTWEEFKMNDSSKLKVELNEKGKYLVTQELYALEYSDDRNDYEDDISFSNFRVMNIGNLRKDYFYRSASPCDNQHKRAKYANRLAEEYGIKFALNLSDDEKRYKTHEEDEGCDSEYYHNLYDSGNVILLGLNANYRSEEFAKTLVDALFEMSNHDGPVLIHCVEGKDRTGFVCALLAALADSTYEEIVDDYMITFKNYYKVTKAENPEKYEAIKANVDDFIYFLTGAEEGVDLASLDLKKAAQDYLYNAGLNAGQVNHIESYLVQGKQQ